MKDMKDIREIETENFKFFQHRDCEFFPCHEDLKEEEFNCLFCYCPLYALGENCGGNFVYLDNGCKDCSNCTIPHDQSSYEYILEKFEEIKKLAWKKL